MRTRSELALAVLTTAQQMLRENIKALTREEKIEGAFGSRFFMRGEGFGMGVAVVEDVGQTARLGSVGRNGWSGAAGTWYWVDPRERLVGILMIQAMRDSIGSE